jgi:shikimate dehydrogenase
VASVTGRTRVVGIIGDPVAHSRSPAMHNAAFAALGLDYVYVPFQVRSPDLAAAVEAIRALGLLGVNVTVPHKEQIMPMLDSLSDRAKAVGAVNTVVNRRGHLFGDNTDVLGVREALRAAGCRLRGRTLLLVGAGGAARSVIAAAVRAGAVKVILVNRSWERANALASHLAHAGATIVPRPLSALTDAALLRDAAAVVNATALGWNKESFPPLAYEATPARCVFLDLVYGVDTDFLRKARRARRPAADGAEMLLHQGAAAFRLWTRRPAPLAAMRAALLSPDFRHSPTSRSPRD